MLEPQSLASFGISKSCYQDASLTIDNVICPDMGHSAGWRDADWLARQILCWMFAEESPPEILHFSLLGVCQGVALLRGALNGGKGNRTLTFTFGLKESKDAPSLGIPGPQSALRAAVHLDRILLVLPGTPPTRLQAPKSFRRAIREMLRSSRNLKPWEPCPPLAQYLDLRVDRDMPVEDLALQLVIILSRWGLLEINEYDREDIVKYLCAMFRKPKKFERAAEEAVSYVFLNWVAPQHWQDLRRYAWQTVWGLYAQGARVAQERKQGSSNCSMKDYEERTELQRQRTTKGKRLLRPQPEHLSVFQLAQLSGISLQRIYEKIKAKELLAVKIGSSLRIERTAAHEFLLQSNRKHEIQILRRRLLELGITKDTVRKRIYRLRKAGVTDAGIAEVLEKMISQS